MKMIFRTQLQDLPTVVLFILCSTLLFLLVARTERELPEMISLPIKLQGSPDYARDLESVTGFEWETELDRTKEAKPFGLQSLEPPAATRHPLEIIYPNDYRFRLNEPNKCMERKPFLVLLVITEPQHVSRRKAIRQTWGHERSVPGVSILCLFLTGVHPRFGSPLQHLLEEESSIYRDIIQQDFLDTYNNLTLKTLMGMEWISKFCPNATYVMKVDSDIFLNVDYMVSKLLQPHLPPKKDYMTGYIYRNTKPLRNKAYKWYVPQEVYPNDTYPAYCGGPGYVLSGDLAKKIYQVAKNIKVINMEDSFMGICLHELGISVTDSPWGLFNMYKISYEKCQFSKLVVVHHYGPDELLQIWPDFQDQNKTCDN
ncbi:beta-1,3-galactosyltransferase 2-like [Rhineura floridana]|uniref:beta-1,3-galactosyltransferase 2-like n=1 Tax=Rhineura floridana TaxID=261503 RepID=UPI002AC871CC|nr:beta-1,3-galactosyltransferase 2-like [Rhineura floridana]XP_061439631.1 beta-1,3-galactosyltransferase 2-like [Rhineura floridana]XP_061439642.1 beta-1,3-galactosyltransferase 2-like [Rhineura floridana]XP_061439650.1 beta-1,3-galactosyltransferase 2-like [Rhineura floridana]